VNRFQYVEKFINSNLKFVIIDIFLDYFIIVFVRRIIEIDFENLFRTKKIFEEIILCSPASLASENQRVIDFINVALMRSKKGKLFMEFIEIRNYNIKSFYYFIVFLNIFRNIFDQQLKIIRIAENEYRAFEKSENSYLFLQRFHDIANIDNEIINLRDIDFEF
jgi:hypothetical protein